MTAFLYRDGDVVPRDVIHVVVHPSVRVLPRQVFRSCYNLSAVELAGIINVEEDAFSRCNSLERIRIPSRAFVVQQGIDRDYVCCLVTDGTMTNTIIFGCVLIASGCLTTLPKSNLWNLGNLINAIMNSGEGTEEDRLGRVRQEVRMEVGGEVSAILGLTFWKAKIDKAERACIDAASDRHKNTGELGRNAEDGTVLTQEARAGCRDTGKVKEIVQNVLPFLDGLW